MKTQHSGAQKFALTHPDTGAHWQTFAAQWALFSSPGRPCAEDVSLFEEMLAAETDLFIATAKRRAWLLGVQPESLKPGAGLTPTVQRTLEALVELLSKMPACASVASAIVC